MDIHLFVGDNDPHLPKISSMSFAYFSFAKLVTSQETDKKLIELNGRLGSNFDHYNDERTAKLFNDRLNMRVCLYCEMEKYFLENALLTYASVEEKKVRLVFEVDDHTKRNDEIFKENPIEHLEELISTIDEKTEELRSVVEELQGVVEEARSLLPSRV